MRGGRGGRVQFENPRALKHKIEFYETTEIKNSYGEFEPSPFNFLFDAKAEILSLGVENGIVSEGLQIQTDISLRLRYTDAINEGLIILFNAEYYEIKSSDNPGGHNVELIINGSKFIQNNGS